MKTLTEFSAPTLKNALRIQQELIAAGKTPEELPAAMGEALKLEGDKLTLILHAIEVVDSKVNDLKRVLVCTVNEGEKAPSGAREKEGKQFLLEYYAPMGGQGGRPDGKSGRGERGGRGDRKKGRGGRGGDRKERGGEGRPMNTEGRGPRPRRPDANVGGGAPRPVVLPKPRPPISNPAAAPVTESAAEGAPANAETPQS